METTTFTITTMHDDAAGIAVAKALEAVNGVDNVHINLAHGRAKVGFDKALASNEQLRAAVQTAGFVIDEAPRQGCCGGCGG